MRDVPADVSAVLVPACSDRLGSVDADWVYLRARGFEGKVDQVSAVPGPSGVVLFVVGLGPSTTLEPNTMRRAAAVAARTASRHDYAASYLLAALDEMPERDAGDRVALAQAMAEGLCLGSYQFDQYKSKPEANRLQRVAVVSTGGQRVQRALELGARIADGQRLARDLVNEPGGSLTPPVIADRIEDIARAVGVECTVWDEKKIATERLGGLLGVNRGSTQPPRFVQLRYTPSSRPRGVLAAVGKGITFDSGGLSIKTGQGMMTMKNDMGGAAAVVGAFSVLDAIAPRCEVRAYLPFTDNMSDGDAMRPGDVLRIRNGKTVEVLNTDAEGRLVLADALSLAAEGSPDAVVDLATLTGAVESALGSRIAGLMARADERSDAWVGQVRDAAARAGERVWPLPLPPDYRKHLDSDVADLRNISRVGSGGALTAGLFLQEFVPSEVPWVHLDIAGAAWSNDVDGELAKGGTGFGVRLLVELMRGFRKPSATRR